jgi:hypothetical protein
MQLPERVQAVGCELAGAMLLLLLLAAMGEAAAAAAGFV